MQTENHSRKAVRATALLLASLAIWVLASMRAGGAVVTFTNNTFIAATNLAYDGQDIIVNACTITTDGPHAFNSVLLTNIAALSIAGGTTLSVAEDLRLATNSTLICQGANTSGQVSNDWAGVGSTIVASNVTVGAGSAISADGQGYSVSAGGGGAGAVGPGGGGAGSYGGHGSGNSGPTYGDATQPTDLGSSGGVGGFGGSSSGGGGIRLEVANSLELDGSITANGQSSGNGGGAAGGSVYITTGSLTGSGTVTANGNQGFNSQGGGGRIAVHFANASGYAGFTNCTANGAESGTVGFFDTSVPNMELSVYQNFSFGPDNVLHLGGITVDNAATVVLGGGSALQVDGALVVRNGSTLLLQGKNVTGQVNGQWAGAGVTIVASNVTVGAGSAISADGQGYSVSAGGGGAGAVGPGGGGAGSYGGHGSGNSGPTYGDATQPTDLGSSGGVGGFGGSSSGGGGIRLEVANSLELDGSITANGQSSGNGGGAAGGSVYITTGSLTGSGTVTANGNQGFVSQGGGGRIAVYFANASGYAGFTNCTANGAENGTVGFFDTSVRNTELSVYQNFSFGPDSVLHLGGITVDNAATVVLGGGSALQVDGALVVRNGSTLLLQGKNVTGQVNGQWVGAGVTIVASNVTVGAGSAISADGQGYSVSAGGGGAGAVGPGGGGAGSYGGHGSGNSGPTYGDATQPTDLGSSGGVGGFGGSSSGGGGH